MKVTYPPIYPRLYFEIFFSLRPSYKAVNSLQNAPNMKIFDWVFWSVGFYKSCENFIKINISPSKINLKKNLSCILKQFKRAFRKIYFLIFFFKYFVHETIWKFLTFFCSLVSYLPPRHKKLFFGFKNDI